MVQQASGKNRIAQAIRGHEQDFHLRSQLAGV
jgi:hypothetical protein